MIAVWLAVLTAFATPADLQRAVLLGDCDTVAQQLPQPSTDGERLVRAWCARTRAPDRARAMLDPLPSAPYRRTALHVRAEAGLAADRPEVTLDALDALGDPSDAATLLRGRALLAQERSLDARPLLRGLLDGPLGVEARYWLAVGGEQRGATAPAIATYRRVWIDGVRGPWSVRAAEALERLGAPVPDVTTEEGQALVRARIDTLARAHRHDAALSLIRALEQATGEVPAPIQAGRVWFEARRYPEAVAAWTSVTGSGDQATGAPGLLFDLALATSRTGDYDAAAVVYRRVVALHPGDPHADEASFKLGYLPYDAGDCDAAVDGFEAHLKRYTRSRHADEAHWFAGWCRFRQGDEAAARRHWKALRRSHPRSALVPAVDYWLARTGPKPEAALAEVARAHPGTSYALFATDAKPSPKPPPPAPPPWPEALADDPRVVEADALLALGLAAAAQAPLAALERADLGRDGTLALAHRWIAAGAPARGRSLAQRLGNCFSPHTLAGQDDLLAACWPRPAHAVVAPVAEAHRLDPLLPYAIMLAESALDPDVTSYAGARGLMQLMPADAEDLHDGLGLGTFDADRLYLAPYNALLGTTLLGRATQALDGLLTPSSLAAVVARYNAGEAPVRRWVDAGGGPPMPADRFAEDIGYTQTRRYVRRVLGYLATYRWVYGTGTSSDTASASPG